MVSRKKTILGSEVYGVDVRSRTNQENLGDVAKVEEVVTARWRREELFRDLVVDLDRA